MTEYKVIVDEEGTRRWFNQNGEPHREDGPAVEWFNGAKSWWINGTLHRKDGPAVEDANGGKEWWINDKRHREDGPAAEYTNGHKAWYLNGEKLTEEEFIKQTKAPCTNKTITIDGVEYKLIPIK